jgi:Na+-transporting NADH:ubiquinone oxidoreductase subunit B
LPLLRKHTINEGFLVTGMLIPLIMPIDVPLWMLAVATILQLLEKKFFCGTGMNILNPALTARAFLFFAIQVKCQGTKFDKHQY